MPDEAVVAPVVEAPPDPLAALQKSFDELKVGYDEQVRTTQHWYNKATAPPVETKVTPAVVASEDEQDILDVITAKGSKGFDELLDKYAKKRGFVSREEAESITNSKASQLTEEAALVKEYPELGDKKSEFFLATANEYATLVKAHVSQPLAMRLAAEKVELAFMRAGKIDTPAQKVEKVKAIKEADRKARIAAQSGERGTNRRSEPDPDESDELTAVQENVAVRMLEGMTGEDGKPYTREQAIAKYKARAKSGVQVRGGGR
jgi:hypothetical protein